MTGPKDKNDAHDKGEQDYWEAKEKACNRGFIDTVIHAVNPMDNNYNPPDGKEKEYREGWENAKKQDKG